MFTEYFCNLYAYKLEIYGRYTFKYIGQICGISSLFCLKLSSDFVLKLTNSLCLPHLLPPHPLAPCPVSWEALLLRWQSPCHHLRHLPEEHLPMSQPAKSLALPFPHFNFFVVLSEITFALFLLSLFYMWALQEQGHHCLFHYLQYLTQ